MIGEIRRPLSNDRTIDIVTTGAKTGSTRTTEIWFTNIGGRIIICGTPNATGHGRSCTPRDWLANLKANPQFLFVLKESLSAQLPARAVPIVDHQDRELLMNAPETKWYREQVESVEELIERSPIVEVFFEDFTCAE